MDIATPLELQGFKGWVSGSTPEGAGHNRPFHELGKTISNQFESLVSFRFLLPTSTIPTIIPQFASGGRSPLNGSRKGFPWQKQSLQMRSSSMR